MKTLIGVCGSGGKTADISSKVYSIAEKIGCSIAEKQCVLVCGGRGGVMNAACRGAKQANGITLGILPQGKEEANQFVDIALGTHLSFQRNMMIAQVVDGMIALAGSWGTLSELSSAMILEKPLVLVETGEGIVDQFIQNKMLPDSSLRLKRTNDPGVAVDLVLSLIEEGQDSSKH